MAGLDASPSESDFGISVPHLLGLAGLVGGIGLFLAVSSRPQMETLESPPSKGTPLAAAKPRPRVAVAPDSDPTEVFVAKPALPLPPAIAERRPQVESAKKIVIPPLVAAVAERPAPQVAAADDPASRRPQWSEFQLESYLEQQAATVGLSHDQAKSVLEEVLESNRAKPSLNEQAGPHEAVLAKLAEGMAQSLPFADAKDCKLEQSQARFLETYSRLLHSEISLIDRSAPKNPPPLSTARSTYNYLHRDSALANAIQQEPQFQSAVAIPALTQILQIETEPVRAQMVNILADNPRPEATRALVNRAVFDLSPEVRHYANMALKDRSPKQYRLELLDALRYPWSPVAWNAAETLIAVKDEKAVPDLINLLDCPDPAKPFEDPAGKMVVRELARINHLQNCLLCHAPSQGRGELVSALVPTPGQSLRPVYYGSHGFGRDVLVRADVTYLRQDFSVMHTVEESKSWPNRQRFDYLVRTREATAEEIASMKTDPKAAVQYPQREAVLTALRKLSGQNAGNESAAWRRLKL